MVKTTITVDINDKLEFLTLLNKYKKIKFRLTQEELFGILLKVMKKYDPELKELVK